ncbi:MAG: N-6 DNA methylase [Candidatus Planktophila sp.]|nr:N-6 DNA methylase [Candidatus Planktophila sp.]
MFDSIGKEDLITVTELVIPDNKISDFIDGKFRIDTPEERVRQNILRRIIDSLHYSKDQVKVEFTIKMGSNKPRIDIAIFPDGASHEQENIAIIVECKKESVSPSDRKEGVGQLKSYMAASLNAEWGLWTNGRHREVWKKAKGPKGELQYLEQVDVPPVTGELPSGRTRNDLDRAVGEVLLYAFKTSHNQIHAIDGFQKEKAFFELLKLIFCKIWDEKNVPNDLEFFVRSSELGDPDGQLACKKRIEAIFERVKAKFPQIFAAGESIDLNPRSLVRVVAELQNFSLLSTNIDIKGKAYEEIVGSNLKGDRGQFFTPRNVMEMAVRMLNPKDDERVLDPACGTGGFIVTAMLHSMSYLESSYEKKLKKKMINWGDIEKQAYNEKMSETIASNFYGFDITPELVKASKMNMVMNNDGSGNVFHTDSLLPPYMWTLEFRQELSAAVSRSGGEKNIRVSSDKLRSAKDLAMFDIIVTNPPFGTKIEIKDRTVLEQFDLGHIWERDPDRNGSWRKTERLQSGVPPEQLFVERCVQFLVPGGRMAIVLPDSILSSPGLAYIRQWMLQNCKLIASVDMHVDTFQPMVGVQTSILILEKLLKPLTTPNSDFTSLNYEVFMAIVEKVGHDKRGQTLYKRDQLGRELLQEIQRVTQTPSGNNNIEKYTDKIVDDQCPLLPPIFFEWKNRSGISW